MTKQELIDFEAEVAAAYNAGKIRAPVHLSAGNEDQLLEVFKRVKPHDYVFSTWRSHYHALLHGVPREELMARVLKGESITICVPERRFHSSAICGGCLPIALGVAWSIRHQICKRCVGWTKAMNLPPYDKCPDCGSSEDKQQPHVWCFVGDMAAEMGAFTEATRYAANHDLPITYVVEDNSMCVNTPTAEVWGGKRHPSLFGDICTIPDNMGWMLVGQLPTVVRYQYTLGWPHMGAGRFIDFGHKKLAPTGGM